ncbi:MAG TPA: c-type cytochrome [Beijerinckiaceae bacterium]|nr:c-type cytochrome [Beijerinckiaceae bacterium]
MVLWLGLCLAGCNAFGSNQTSDAQRRGADLIVANGCGTCHSIPGIAGAWGNVGPPLDHIGTRVFIAGMLRNSPDNMVRWLKNPQAIIPGNAMPNMNLNDAQARDITAYLAELQ